MSLLMIRRPSRSTRTDTLFPTRRSSDLMHMPHAQEPQQRQLHLAPLDPSSHDIHLSSTHPNSQRSAAFHREYTPRSEEHTSELQSLMRIAYAVICVKKIKNNYTKTLYSTTLSNPDHI